MVKNLYIKTNPSFIAIITQVFVLDEIRGKLIIKDQIRFRAISTA